ncbi:MAG: TIGR00159 family protein [Clostridiaceae bacterium]|jgi:diadenylate cyclase|nr:TIGR00159 family protein [Clostridiaceae bacterium]
MTIGDVFSYITNFLGLNSPLDIIRLVIEISLISYVVYKGIQLVRETRALQLVKGLLFILIFSKFSEVLGLKTIAYLLKGTIQLFGFGLIVIFQPELRRALEKLGSSGFQDIMLRKTDEDRVKTISAIESVVKACTALSQDYIGALIIIERATKIGDIVNTGTQMDAMLSSELLLNIFTPKTPLHDGAVIIRNNTIKAAACYLPLTQNAGLSRELGTRHRAALGITEVSDAIAVVVSEESGKISYAHSGGLTRNLTPDMLRKALTKFLLDTDTDRKLFTFRKVKQDEQTNK